MTTGGGALFEREAEVARLEAALSEACDGRGGALTIRGPAGIGKTSLLRSAASRGRELGMLVLTAQGSELEREFPFGVVRQLFEARLTAASEEERAQLLAGAAELGAAAVGIKTSRPSQPDPSFGLLHGLYWLAANLCLDAPLLLAVDDAQLADQASLRFFVYLVRRLEDLPILALFTRRTGDAETDRALVNELSSAGDIAVMTPQALTGEGAARLLEAELGTPQDGHLISRCHNVTGGNPFLLVELARDLRRGGAAPTSDVAVPESVTHAISVRLGRLGGEVVALAKAVVVLGDGCTLSEAAELAELPLAAASAAVSAMVRSEILTRENELRFVHPLVRGAIESDLTAAERMVWHGQAATILIERGASDQRVATHLMLAVPERDPEKFEVLRRAANLALARGEPETAASLLQRALRELPSDDRLPDVLGALGQSELLAGDGARALTHLQRAWDLAPDVVSKAACAIPLSKALVVTQGPGAAAELLERSADQLGADSRELLLEIETEIALVGVFDVADSRRLWRRLDAFTKLNGETLGERRVLAALGLRYSFDGTADVFRTREVARRALAGGELVREEGLNYLNWAAALTTLVSTGALEEVEAVVDIALDHARALGSIHAAGSATGCLQKARLYAGRLQSAEAEGRLVLELIEEMELTPLRVTLGNVAAQWTAEAMVDAGRIDAARALLEEHMLLAEVAQDVVTVQTGYTLAKLHLAAGEPELALQALSGKAEQEAVSGWVEPWRPWRALAVQAHLGVGDSVAARRLAAEQLKIARRWRGAREVGIALRTCAATREADDRLALLEQAVATLEPSPARLELAQALFDLGSCLRAAGRRTEAKARLRMAAELAQRCGARPLVERASEELRVLGARPRRLMFSGVEGLTASERRVAKMATLGMTNRQIAQALFVTPKTVEAHLGSAYRKLDIQSRDQLAAVLGDDQDERPQTTADWAARGFGS